MKKGPHACRYAAALPPKGAFPSWGGPAMKKARLVSVVDVHIIFENEKGEWLFSRRANTGYKDGQFSLVAGHLEPGESLKACAIREAMEEAGVAVDTDALELRHVMRRDSDQHRISFFFLCRTWTGALENREPHKCAGFLWRRPDEPPLPIVDHVERAIQSIRTGELVGDYTAPGFAP